MTKRSAGIIPYRLREGRLEVLLVHPGGPFWAKKDERAWSIAKGEYGEDEDAFVAARREFHEETGFTVAGDFIALGEVKQPGGKRVQAWAVAAELDPAALESNHFTMEWPPRSGREASFPEVDGAEWVDLESAARKLHKGLVPFLARLEDAVKARGGR